MNIPLHRIPELSLTIRREVGELLRVAAQDRPTIISGTLLLLAVLCLILTQAVAFSMMEQSSLAAKIAEDLNLSRDHSFGESVGYCIAFLAAALFFLTSLEQRSRVLLFLAALMAFVWFDDSAMYHERLGGWLAATLDFPSVLGLRPIDLGELLSWTLAALLLCGVLIWSLGQRQPGDLGILAIVLAMFAILLMFGVVGDMVHILLPENLNLLVGMIEDGGELLAVTLIATCAIGLSRQATAYYKACITPATRASRAAQYGSSETRKPFPGG